MKIQTTAPSNETLVVLFARAFGFLLIGAVVAGLEWNWISNIPLMMIVVTILGATLCAFAIGKVAHRREWLNPFALFGYLTGALIVLIVATTLMGIPLPFIANERIAFLWVVSLGGIKMLTTALHHTLARV